MRVCLCVIFFGNSYLQGASCLCEFCSWQWQTVVYSAFLCVYVCVCVYLCVCLLSLSLSTYWHTRRLIHTQWEMLQSVASLSALLLCVSCVLYFSNLLLLLLLPHSLLMAQMWRWHTGSSLLQRQHKAVVSIFKHFGRRRFHVICNQTSVQLWKLTMLLVRQFPFCVWLGVKEEDEEEEQLSSCIM